MKIEKKLPSHQTKVAEPKSELDQLKTKVKNWAARAELRKEEVSRKHQYAPETPATAEKACQAAAKALSKK
ncbi:MAG: hypothetical protein JSS61_00985 [Verrucomicrobia bacterium]|nr:hypothetical protein [Verrucomicrobiota bacterium]